VKKRGEQFPSLHFVGGLSVKAKQAFFILICCLAIAASAQEPTVIPLASEPHHHLALHNAYVNVYQVEVAPHDSVLLHRHDADAISIMLSNSEVTVRAPGKPDVHQKLSEGQLRLQARGYVHATSIDGDTTYRNVTVELLLPQQGARNLCALVIAALPLNCPSAQTPPPAATHIEQPQFETGQTYLTLIRVLPHQSAALGDPDRPELIVALDAVATAGGKGLENSLHPGDFVWLKAGKAAQVFKNNDDKEARLISFALKPPGSAE
jgi:quercetin dioxygenase-like cupin family protein